MTIEGAGQTAVEREIVGRSERYRNVWPASDAVVYYRRMASEKAAARESVSVDPGRSVGIGREE